MNILADATLPGLHKAFPYPFSLTLYHCEKELISLLPDNEILICRSTLKVNSTLLKKHSLRYIATASSGTDHLDKEFLTSQNIGIFDARGSNAISVADYVHATLAWLDRNTLIGGPHIAIIGMGYVGTEVYKRLKCLNYRPMIYDPLKELHAPSFTSCAKHNLYDADILCIHPELHRNHPYPSYQLIDNDFLGKLKNGTILINASRGGVVHEDHLLSCSNHIIYCTDVYLNEPMINPEIIDFAHLCTPHIAGHSLEAKYGAVAMVSEKIHRLFKLPLPEWEVPPKDSSKQNKKGLAWQEQILTLYNPEIETMHLKKAHDKQEAFLKLRKEHNFRHDFELCTEYFPNT